MSIARSRIPGRADPGPEQGHQALAVPCLVGQDSSHPIRAQALGAWQEDALASPILLSPVQASLARSGKQSKPSGLCGLVHSPIGHGHPQSASAEGRPVSQAPAQKGAWTATAEDLNQHAGHGQDRVGRRA